MSSFESGREAWARASGDPPTQIVSERLAVVRTSQREGAVCELGEEEEREVRGGEDLGQK